MILAWEPLLDTNLASYVVHWGTNSGQYIVSTNCGTATNLVLAGSNLFSGKNFFILTANDAAGNIIGETVEISFNPWPANFRVKLSMDSAPSPTGPWSETITLTNSFAVQDTAYFRGRLDIQPSSGVP